MSMNRWGATRSIFDRGPGPAPMAAGDGLEGAYSAILHTAPSGGSVKVTVPGLWGLTTARQAICSSSFTGSPGDRVLVMFDDDKELWVIATSA